MTKIKGVRSFSPVYSAFFILAVSLLILNLGASSRQEKELAALKFRQADRARELLATLALGSDIRPYLSRICQALSKKLSKIMADRTNTAGAGNRFYNPHRPFLNRSFPEHEIWVFALPDQGSQKRADPVFYPKKSRTSRRGMANAIIALEKNDTSGTANKLIDFLFGPNLRAEQLAKRRGKPTRIIYCNRHYYLVWNRIVADGKTVGGFIFLAPDTRELTLYAMNRTSLNLTRKFNAANNGNSQIFAGYLNVFDHSANSLFPPEIAENKELSAFVEKWRNPPSLKELERQFSGNGEVVGNSRFFSQVIPDANFLAAVLLKKPDNLTFPLWINLLNLVFLCLVVILLLAVLRRLDLPNISLNARFSLLFLSLASVPCSLLFVASDLYLQELEFSMVTEARQKLQLALASFDQNVEDVNLSYRNEFRKLHEENWALQALQEKQPIQPQLAENFLTFFKRLKPSLPWASFVISDPEGRTILQYRSAAHQKMVEGYVIFNRVGIIEAMRQRQKMPSIEEEGETDFINQRDIRLKTVYETQIKLPISHPFTNANVGNTVQVAFGDLSIMRLVDYFPSEQLPRFAVSVVWQEEELNREFSIAALKLMKKEFPGISFEVFQKNDQQLERIVRTHRYSNLFAVANSSFLRHGFSFNAENDFSRIEIALPSNRRPGIFLAGSMDTSYIGRRLNFLSSRFFLIFLLGLFAVFFFRNLLSQRLILPLLLLEKNLRLSAHNVLQKLPESTRTDEFKNIFASFNEMIESIKIRSRLISLVSQKALKVAREETETKVGKGQTNLVIEMVSDIRSFTTMCEQYPPEMITSLLNRHFDRMTEIILNHGGEIGRFVGDAIEASFFCTTEDFSSTAENAVKASLLMLEAIDLINEERASQGIFPYKIGVGLAFGKVRIFSVGDGKSRTEVLQVGRPLKTAALLEASTRDFPQCPLCIDEEIAVAVRKQFAPAAAMVERELDGMKVFYFNEKPELQGICEENSLEPEEDIEWEKQRKIAEIRCSAERLQEKVIRQKHVFSTTFFFLLVCFFIILAAVYSYAARQINKNENLARKANRQTLNSARFNISSQEMLGSRFDHFMEMTSREILANRGPASMLPQELMRKKIDQELKKFGLKPVDIAVLPFEPTASEPGSEGVETVLKEALRCYDAGMDRFLLPDGKTLAIFGNSLTQIVFTRDGRASFIPVSYRRKSCWLFWKPILKPFSEWRQLWQTPVSTSMKIYGTFSREEVKRALWGGVMVVCEAPEEFRQLNIFPDDKNVAFFEIDLNAEKITKEQVGEGALPPEIFANCEDNRKNYEKAKIEKLLEIAYAKKDFKSELIVDLNLVSGKHPQLQLAIKNIGEEKKRILVGSGLFTFLAILLFLVGVLAWGQFLREKGLAKTIARQILGSFMATIMIPVAGLFFLISLLYGDLQNNLLEKSRSKFLEKIDLIEQKVQLHHASNPAVFRKILENNGVSRFFAESVSINKDPDNFQKIQNSLKEFLGKVFTEIGGKRLALGLNSVMIDAVNGLSEYLLLHGVLAQPGDPMQRTFSFQAYRIINRINPEAVRNSDYQKDPKQLIVDEVAANEVFDILASAYGEEAYVEILFGQGKSVKLFGGASVDGFYQEFFPDAVNPLGVMFFALSFLHSNHFAMSRILAARHFSGEEDDPMSFQTFCFSRINPGMPAIPCYGEKFPFLRDVVRNSLSFGKMEKLVHFVGEDYLVVTHHSKVLPQFVFVGLIKVAAFDRQMRFFILRLASLLVLAFLVVSLLSIKTSKDLTGPMNLLLQAIDKVKSGNYKFSISFAREDELEEIARAFNDMLNKLSEKELLAKMVSASAVKIVSGEEFEAASRHGQKIAAAVLYCGIPDFSGRSEKTHFDDFNENLNHWFEKICSSVSRHGGEINKVLEGKVLAVFFLETGESEAAAIERALSAAVAICRREKNEENFPTSTGMHFGEVISGFIGNEARRDFTVIGDTVNFAARCFAAAEELHVAGGIILTERCAASLQSNACLQQLGRFSVKGKAQPQLLFTYNLHGTNNLIN